MQKKFSPQVIHIPDDIDFPKIGAGRTSEVFDMGQNKVLKLYFRGWSDSWVCKEYETGKMTYGKGIPVPKVIGMAGHHGRKGVIFESVKGTSMMKENERIPWKAKRYARLLAELQHNFHQKEGDGLPSSKEIIENLIAEKTLLQESVKRGLSNFLNSMKHGSKICHGDYHPGNVLFTAEGPVIIDWMSATKGNPLGDGLALLYCLKFLSFAE